MTAGTLVRSTFQNRPAYRYLRTTDRLPSTDEAWSQADPVIKVKLFDPQSGATWFVAGFDPETGRAFGAARITDLEVGDFQMSDLIALRGRFGLPIERDLFWRPAPLSAVLDGSAS